jgi:DNA-binding LytR/AlgR family response regulator
MSKLKVALLEDSIHVLKDLKMEMEDTGLVQVVAWATTSTEFLEKVKTVQPDILVLDIDLNGDAMSGLDVAAKLKLPVLFVSGKMASYVDGVSGIDVQLRYVPVKYITKPITSDKLNAILPKFIQQVRAMSKPQGVTLTLKDEGRRTIDLDSIVCLCAEKDTGSSSGNKEIHFIDRKPAVLVDFSFTTMDEKGLAKDQFLTIHKSYRVNATHAKPLDGEVMRVMVMDAQGKVVEKVLPVSENYRPGIRKLVS